MNPFPRDITGVQKLRKEREAKEKARLILVLIALLNIVLFLILNGIFGKTMVITVFIVCVQISVYVAIAIFIWRFMIFREHEQMQEDRDSVLRYYKLWKKEAEVDGITINYHEDYQKPYVLIQFKAGMYSEKRKRVSEKLIKDIFDTISNLGIKVHLFGVKEDFQQTREHEYIMNKLHMQGDRLTKMSGLQMYSHLLLRTKEESCIMNLYLKLYVTSKIFDFNLAAITKRILMMFEETKGKSTFREVSQVPTEEHPEIMREYLKMTVLDLNYAQMEQIIEDKQFLDIIHLDEVMTEEGNIYETTSSQRISLDDTVIKLK